MIEVFWTQNIDALTLVFPALAVSCGAIWKTKRPPWASSALPSIWIAACSTQLNLISRTLKLDLGGHPISCQIQSFNHFCFDIFVFLHCYRGSEWAN